MGNVFFGEAAEVAHFDDFHHSLIHFGKLVEGVAHAKDFLFGRMDGLGYSSVECHVHLVASPTLRVALAHGIDDDRAHNVRRVGQEMRTLRDAKPAGLENAQKCLMNQRRRVEQSQGLVATESGAGELAKLLVQNGKELLRWLAAFTQ